MGSGSGVEEILNRASKIENLKFQRRAVMAEGLWIEI